MGKSEPDLQPRAVSCTARMTLAFDVANSLEAARVKGVEPPISARLDVLIVPNLEAGNLLYKQLVHFADAECAGVVPGAKVPIVLTSRAAPPAAAGARA